MALTFGRKYDEGSMATGQSFGAVVPDSDILVYQVPGEKKADVLAHPSLIAVLAAEHPDIPGLMPFAANPTERIGSGTDVGWNVEVQYGRNRLSGSDVRITPPDTTDLAYKLDSTSTRSDPITIPIVVETQITFPQPLTGIPVTQVVIRTVELKRTVAKTIYNLRLNTSTFGLAEVLAVEAQTDRVHTISGKKWLFRGGDMDEIEEGVYTLTYEWLSDPGTPEISIPEVDGINQAVTTPARGPFQDYVVRLYTETSGPLAGQTRARVELVDTYDEDATGWMSLPGSPFT